MQFPYLRTCSFLLVLLCFCVHGRVSQLSVARVEMGATSVGDLALFAGGRAPDYSSFRCKVVDIYNATSNCWSTAELSTDRFGIAATSVGDLALFAGGAQFSGSNPYIVCLDRVDIYNATSNSWLTASLSVARCFIAATSVGDLALFAGGSSFYGNNSKVVDIYNATSNSWSTASLSVARSGVAATSVGDLALFAGGAVADGYSSEVVDIYNATSNSWLTANLSFRRYAVAATSVGNLALFAGGTVAGGTTFVNLVDIYNATSNSWSTTALSKELWNLAATSVGNLALFAGGFSSLSNRVDIYNATSNSWSTAALSSARSLLAATSVGNIVLFAGGYNDGSGGAARTVDLLRPCTTFSDCDDYLFCTQGECINGFCQYSTRCSDATICIETAKSESGKGNESSSRTILIAALVPSLLVAVAAVAGILFLLFRKKDVSSFYKYI